MSDVPSHAERGRLGAFRSWANTPDRTARTRKARAKSPSSDHYWLERLDPERFSGATDEQRLAAAQMARRAYFAELSIKAQAARRAKRHAS